MEKRFFLALLLTALVVIGTPRLFPTPEPRRAPPGALVDDTAPRTVAPPPANPDGVSPLEPAAAPVLRDTLRADPVPSVAVDTAVVETPLAVYRFIDRGATPHSVVLRHYRSLRTDTETVALTTGAEPLLRYRVIFPDDTVRFEALRFELERTEGEGRPGASPELRYSAPIRDGRVVLTYSFVPDSYLVRVRGTIEGARGPAFLVIDLPPTLRSEEADTVADVQSLAYSFKRATDSPGRFTFNDLKPGERRIETGPLTWVAVKSKYFLVALLAEPGGPAFTEIVAAGEPRTGKLPTRARGTTVMALDEGAFSFELYTGPQELRRLLALGRDLENVNPYGSFMQAFVQPFATVVMHVLLWMRDTLQVNYGWILIIFGIVVRLILWPLNQRAMRSSLQMQRLQPQLAEVQKRHAKDPERYRQEIMRVYKEHGMSPFSPVMGCLPMLLPMPVLIALFFVFQNTIEFRGVSFLWLPDISLKDPYYIIPILMGLSMFLLSWIGLRSAPPNPQAKVMAYVFPVLMTVLFLNFASGLNLYYFVQNLAALPQQWLIARERARVSPPVPATS